MAEEEIIQPGMTERQMLYHSMLGIARVEKRQEKHSAELHSEIDKTRSEVRSELDKIWSELKELRKDEAKELKEKAEADLSVEARLVRLETERSTLKSVLTVLFSIFGSGGLSAWLVKILTASKP